MVTYVSVNIVGGPGSANGLLSPDVPHHEFDVLVDDLLDVAPDRGRRRHYLVEQPYWSCTQARQRRLSS